MSVRYSVMWLWLSLVLVGCPTGEPDDTKDTDTAETSDTTTTDTDTESTTWTSTCDNLECVPCERDQFLICDACGTVWGCTIAQVRWCAEDTATAEFAYWRWTDIPCDCVGEDGARLETVECNPE